jgi:hypothetical protein
MQEMGELPKATLDAAHRFCLSVAFEVLHQIVGCTWTERGHYPIRKAKIPELLAALQGHRTELEPIRAFRALIRKNPFVECLPGSDLPNPAHRDHVLLPVRAVKPLKRAFESFRAELFALVPEGYAAATRLPVAVADRVADLLPHLRHVLARIDAAGRPSNDPPSPGAYWCVKEHLLPAALEVDRLMGLPITISGGSLTIGECDNSILYRLVWAWRHLDAGPALFGGWLAYHPDGVRVFGAVFRELEEMASSLGVTAVRVGPAAPAVPTQDLVTLDQAAGLVHRSKRTLERHKATMPHPVVRGGGGKSDRWRWSDLRPWLERKFDTQLPEIPPSPPQS